MKKCETQKTIHYCGITAILLCATLMLHGCSSSSVFKSLSGGGNTAGNAGALTALQSGNNTAALTMANTVLDNPSASTVDKKEASLIKGEAILGQANITGPRIARILESNSSGGTRNIVALLPRMALSDAISAANALNLTSLGENLNLPSDLGASLGLSPNSIRATTTVTSTANTTTLEKSRYLTRLVANLTVMVELLNRPFEVTTATVTTRSGYTIRSALNVLYPNPDDGTGIMRYAAIVAVTYPYCGLSAANEAIILKAINAAVYVSYIKAAATPSNPYIYRGADGRRITPSSTDAEIEDAVEYEVRKVR